jgi:hypothetical protein
MNPSAQQETGVMWQKFFTRSAVNLQSASIFGRDDDDDSEVENPDELPQTEIYLAS